jgi:hypothetical protein
MAFHVETDRTGSRTPVKHFEGGTTMNETEFFFFTTLFMTAVAVVGMIGWYRATQKYTKLEGRLWGIAAAQGLPMAEALADAQSARTVPGLSPDGNRVVQLEAQVDQLAQQLERVAESQDFLSRVLTDRIDQLPDPRMRTPH